MGNQFILLSCFISTNGFPCLNTQQCHFVFHIFHPQELVAWSKSKMLSFPIPCRWEWLRGWQHISSKDTESHKVLFSNLLVPPPSIWHLRKLLLVANERTGNFHIVRRGSLNSLHQLLFSNTGKVWLSLSWRQFLFERQKSLHYQKVYLMCLLKVEFTLDFLCIDL